MLKAFKKIQTQDYITSIIQDNVDQAVSPIIQSEIIDGILLKNISLVSGQVNQVSHKLNRKPIFWIVARQDSNSVVWESSTLTTDLFLVLNCSANCIINLWIG